MILQIHYKQLKYMKRLFLLVAVALVGLAPASAQKKIPETKTFIHRTEHRTEIILPKVNGFNVYKADLHIHSIYSDAHLTPEQRVKEAWIDGLDIMAMTDHIEYRRNEPSFLKFTKGYNEDGKPHKAVNFNVIRKDATEKGILADLNLSNNEAIKAGKRYGDALLIIPGAEITREPKTIGHYNALWVKDNNTIYDIDPYQSLRNARKQGALITHNHPGWSRKSCDKTEWQVKAYEEGLIDGVEIMNGYWFYPKTMQRCIDEKLYMVGSTDIHALSAPAYKDRGVFRTMTFVFAKENTHKAVRDAIEKRRTLCYSSGNIAGEEKLLVDFFKASVNYQLLSKSKKASLYALTNSTSIAYELQVGKHVYNLAPFETITLSVSKDKSGNDKDLVLTVKNMWKVGYEHPKITFKAISK